MFATRISVNQLRLGMHVVKLDRPWMGSGLPFQGFRLTTERHLQRLREICTSVYVTNPFAQAGKAATPADTGPGEGAASVRADWEDGNSEQRRASLMQALGEAAHGCAETRRYVERTLTDVRFGHGLDAGKAMQVVDEMVEQVASNPDAWLWLTELRNTHEYLVQHCANVAVLSIAFGIQLGIPPARLHNIALAALLHDVGMMRAPLPLLNKSSALDANEYGALKRYANEGYEIVKATGAVPEEALEIIRLHQERTAGSGFANAMNAHLWSEDVRVLSICDVYDALRSDRAYRKAMSPDRALHSMRRIAADSVDDELMDEFVRFIGVYPVGSSVQLATGDAGIVMSRHTHSRLRPVVMLARDASGCTYDPRPCVCLAERDRQGDGSHWRITGVMDSREAGIDMAQVILECMRGKRRLPSVLPGSKRGLRDAGPACAASTP